jgi:hypothetical protein
MTAFKSVLDQLAEQPVTNPTELLLRFNSS